MNPDKGQYVTTKFWYPYFQHLRKLDEAQNKQKQRRHIETSSPRTHDSVTLT